MSDNPLYTDLEHVPIVATHSEINFEKLAEVQPQIVFSSVRAHGVVEEQAHLQGFNIKDIKLNLRNPEVIKEEILLMGQIFNEVNKAAELVDFYNKYEQFIQSRVEQIPMEERRTVFVEFHAGDFNTGAPGSRFYQQTILAGAVNMASTLSGEPQVDAEWVAEMNPDVILREASGFGYGVTSDENVKLIYEEIMNRPALQHTNAVLNKLMVFGPIQESEID